MSKSSDESERALLTRSLNKQQPSKNEELPNLPSPKQTKPVENLPLAENRKVNTRHLSRPLRRLSTTNEPQKVECSARKAVQYDVEEVRNYMQKRKDQRLAEKQKKLVETNMSVEERKKKLQELHKKSMLILAKNRERSRSRDKRTNVENEEQVKCVPEDDFRPRMARKQWVQSELLGVPMLQIKSPPRTFVPVAEQEIVPYPSTSRESPSLPSTVTSSKAEPVNKNTPEQIQAVLTIQKIYRGYRQRKRYRNLLASRPKKKYIPAWLQTGPQAHPYNFINTVKMKLNSAVSAMPQKTTQDVGIQITPQPERSLKELKDMIEKNIKKTAEKNSITPNRLDLKTIESMKLSSRSGSDTSKNVPDLSSESDSNTKSKQHLQLLLKGVTMRKSKSDSSSGDGNQMLKSLDNKKKIHVLSNITISPANTEVVSEKNRETSHGKISEKSTASSENISHKSSASSDKEIVTDEKRSTYVKISSENIHSKTSKEIHTDQEREVQNKASSENISSKISKEIATDSSAQNMLAEKVSSKDISTLQFNREKLKQLKLRSRKRVHPTDNTMHYVKSSSESETSVISSNMINVTNNFKVPDPIDKAKAKAHKKGSNKSETSSSSNKNNGSISTDATDKTESQNLYNAKVSNSIISSNKDNFTRAFKQPDPVDDTKLHVPQASVDDHLKSFCDYMKGLEFDARIKHTPYQPRKFRNGLGDVPKLVAPPVSLQSSSDKENSNRGPNKNIIKLKSGEKSVLETVNAPNNQIHVQFEANLHLLNDFNESLQQIMAIEKSLLELQDKKSSPLVRQNVDTQTSVIKSLSYNESFGSDVNTSDLATLSKQTKSAIAQESILSETKQSSASQRVASKKTKSSRRFSSINLSRGCSFDEDIFDNTLLRSNLEVTAAQNSFDATQNAVVESNALDVTGGQVYQGISIGMFEQLIKDEDARIESLKTMLKIREKTLLDRTRGELAWLEIQKQHHLETGELQAASLVKKRQRGIIMKLQNERQEMQKLREMQKAASKERKFVLREQCNMIKAQLSAPDTNTKIKRTKEKRRSGPIRVLNFQAAVTSETSISKRSSLVDEVIVESKSESVISSRIIESEITDIEIIEENIDRNSAVVAVNERTESARRLLLMREAALQQRRKEVEDLLQWHNRLQEEEKTIAELEMAASNIITRQNNSKHQLQRVLFKQPGGKAAPNELTSKRPDSTQNEIMQNINNISEELYKLSSKSGDLVDDNQNRKRELAAGTLAQRSIRSVLQSVPSVVSELVLAKKSNTVSEISSNLSSDKNELSSGDSGGITVSRSKDNRTGSELVSDSKGSGGYSDELLITSIKSASELKEPNTSSKVPSSVDSIKTSAVQNLSRSRVPSLSKDNRTSSNIKSVSASDLRTDVCDDCIVYTDKLLTEPAATSVKSESELQKPKTLSSNITSQHDLRTETSKLSSSDCIRTSVAQDVSRSRVPSRTSSKVESELQSENVLTETAVTSIESASVPSHSKSAELVSEEITAHSIKSVSPITHSQNTGLQNTNSAKESLIEELSPSLIKSESTSTKTSKTIATDQQSAVTAKKSESLKSIKDDLEETNFNSVDNNKLSDSIAVESIPISSKQSYSDKFNSTTLKSLRIPSDTLISKLKSYSGEVKESIKDDVEIARSRTESNLSSIASEKVTATESNLTSLKSLRSSSIAAQISAPKNVTTRSASANERDKSVRDVLEEVSRKLSSSISSKSIEAKRSNSTEIESNLVSDKHSNSHAMVSLRVPSATSLTAQISDVTTKSPSLNEIKQSVKEELRRVNAELSAHRAKQTNSTHIPTKRINSSDSKSVEIESKHKQSNSQISTVKSLPTSNVTVDISKSQNSLYTGVEQSNSTKIESDLIPGEQSNSSKLPESLPIHSNSNLTESKNVITNRSESADDTINEISLGSEDVGDFKVKDTLSVGTSEAIKNQSNEASLDVDAASNKKSKSIVSQISIIKSKHSKLEDEPKFLNEVELPEKDQVKSKSLDEAKSESDKSTTASEIESYIEMQPSADGKSLSRISEESPTNDTLENSNRICLDLAEHPSKQQLESFESKNKNDSNLLPSCETPKTVSQSLRNKSQSKSNEKPAASLISEVISNQVSSPVPTSESKEIPLASPKTPNTFQSIDANLLAKSSPDQETPKLNLNATFVVQAASPLNSSSPTASNIPNRDAKDDASKIREILRKASASEKSGIISGILEDIKQHSDKIMQMYGKKPTEEANSNSSEDVSSIVSDVKSAEEEVSSSNASSGGVPIFGITIRSKADDTMIVKPDDDDDDEDEEEEKVEEKVDVRRRVSEIMADANLSGNAMSPRLKDIYVTTYDVISPDDSPNSASPTDQTFQDPYGTEAEELLRKQLAIEQEIKQLEQQQKEQLPYLYLREIPNKPPPPYTPPIQTQNTVDSVVPASVQQIDTLSEQFSTMLHQAYKNNTLHTIELPDDFHADDMNRECCSFVFDVCKEIAVEHYSQFAETPSASSWLKVPPTLTSRKPLSRQGLQAFCAGKLRVLFEFEKTDSEESALMKWSRKKRDHVDEILVVESQAMEPWTDYVQDEIIVKNQLTNDIMKSLLNETVAEFERILAKTCHS